MLEFRNRLIKARKDQKFSQVAMAKSLGISRQTYLDLENGKTEPRLSMVIKLADLLKCNQSWLAFGDGSPLTKHNREVVMQAKRILDTLVL